MFINPRIAIENEWIKGIRDEKKQVQPNAIDFTLDSVMQLDDLEGAIITEQQKSIRSMKVVPTYSNLGVGEPDMWLLQGGRVYDGMSSMFVQIPEGIAAILYTRSSFARNGVFIMSGLYDSGYEGHIGFTIYTVGGLIEVGFGTRIGQIAFIKADNAGVYAGGWNHSEGTHYIEGC